MRLYDRRRGRWDETRRCTNRCGSTARPARLRGELQHYAYRDLVASPPDDRSLHDARGRATWRRAAGAPRLFDLLGHPPLAFLRNYLLRGGIRDGAVGLIISSMNAWYVFLKYAKLWELELVRELTRRRKDAIPGRDADR